MYEYIVYMCVCIFFQVIVELLCLLKSLKKQLNVFFCVTVFMYEFMCMCLCVSVTVYVSVSVCECNYV